MSMTFDSSNSRYFIRLIGAGAGTFPVVFLDYLAKVLCGSLPLFVYLVAVFWGAWFTRRMFDHLSTQERSSSLKWRVTLLLALLSFLGGLGLAIMPSEWVAKCAWRNCGRVLGVSLFESPFPVEPVTCRGWSVCINEYPYSDAEYREVLSRIDESGCPPP